jgi:hypothetical protein
MTDEVIIYIAPPSTGRGPWRVRSDHRPLEEFGTEGEAVDRAAKYARMVENAGGTVVIKVERPDGSWETYRA